MSDADFVRRFQRSSNWKYYARIMNALATASDRIEAQRLAAIAGCTQKKFYALIKDIKKYLRITDKLTVHNIPGVGYCLARLTRQRLDEVGKSQLRGISHLNSGSNVLSTIDKKDITNIDEMQALGKYSAVDALSKALSALEPELRGLMSTTAQHHESELTSQTRAPMRLLGLADIYDDDDGIQ